MKPADSIIRILWRIPVIAVAAFCLVEPARANRVGSWISGAANLQDTSGFTPVGTHDGYAVGTNAASLAWSSDVPPGFAGQSLDLSANNVGVLITNSALTDANYQNTFDNGISNMFTVTFWYKGVSLPAFGCWVTKSGNTPMGWQTRLFAAPGGEANFTMRSNSGETEPHVIGGSMATTNAFSSNVWYHYAAVFNGTLGGTASFRKIYINGVVERETTGTPYAVNFSTNAHLMIGAKQQNAPNGTIDSFFPGKMYDVRIFNTPLSSNDILNVMAVPMTPGAAMFTFGLPGIAAVITGTNIVWTVPYGTATNSLAPTYTLSPGATCDKPSGSTQDFSVPVAYTVISSDFLITNVYTVTVIVTPVSTANDILSFGPGATITGTNIAWSVPNRTDVTNLAPTYTVSQFATGTPPSGSTNNFTTPQLYTVTAQDASSKDYVVTVTVQSPPSTNLELVVRDGLMVWLKADAIDTADPIQARQSGTDYFMQRWNDQCFYAHHATNDVEADQPQYVTNVLNGLPALRFSQIDNNTGSKMYLGDLSAHFPSGATLFAVGIIDNDGRYNLFGNRGNNDERWVADTWTESRPGSFRIGRANGTFSYPAWPHSNSHVFVMESDSTVYRMLLNGTEIGSDTPQYHSGSNANWTIGNRVAWVSGEQQFRGDIPELILYNRGLSSDEAEQVGAYLAEKYGLTTTYPPLSWIPEARILHFGSPNNEAVIAGTNIAWTVPYGSDVTTLAPTFTLSAGATCDRLSGQPYDFTTSLAYTVISSDALITNVYTVTVTVTPASSAFVDITNVSISVSYGTASFAVSGTNNAYVVGTMWVTNATAGGARQTFAATPSWTTPAVTLAVGANDIAVTGTNIWGQQAGDTVTIIRLSADEGEYLVVDVSGGPDATFYPTATLSSPPVLNDEYRTTKILMRKIIAGSFVMGSPETELGRSVDEEQHTVTLSSNFYIAVFSTTQGQYSNVMGVNPAFAPNLLHPVEGSSWDMVRGGTWPGGTPGADTFMGKLSTKTGLAFDLPTEAQREYACRAGTTNALHNDTNLTNVYSDGNVDILACYFYNGGSNGHVTVGSYQANNWGLYDMHGDIWNWCLDWYGSYESVVTNPPGPSTGTLRVRRGGTWNSNASACRSAFRSSRAPAYEGNHTGFRAVVIERGGIDTGAPYIDITTTPATVSHDTTNCVVAGTNNVQVVGWLWWSNSLDGTGGSATVSNGSFLLTDVPLAVGTNTIFVYGTNSAGAIASDSVVITRQAEPLPYVDITNATSSVTYETTSCSISGSNNINATGILRWTNELTSGSGTIAVGSPWWSFSASLGVGTNIFTVAGTNAYGSTSSDSVTIIRRGIGSGVPFLDITNADRVIDYQTTTCTIAGTNNAHLVGSLTWTNHLTGASGSLATYDVGFTISDVPLGVGSNVIVVIGTNLLGVVAADTTSVVRLSAPQVLSVQPSMLDFGTNGTYLTVMLGNLSTGNVDFAITPGAAWLSVSPVSGSVSTQSVPVGVTVNRAGMANAFYSGLLTIVPSEGAAIVVTCTMVVADNGVVAHPGGPYVADQGSPVTLDGSGSIGVGLRYSWSIDDFYVPLGTANVRCVYTGYVPGTSDVILTVRDTGSRLSASMTNLIVRNVAPSIEIGGPYTGAVGHAMNFRASIVDPGTGDVIEIRWDFGVGWSGWQPASATNTPFSFALAGNYLVQAEVRDNYGGVGSDSATAFVDVPNMPPEARATLGSPGVVLSNFAAMHMGFILDGSGSTDDRTNTAALYFDWREDVHNPAKPLLTDAQRCQMVLTNAVTFPLPGAYRYHLVVNDGAHNGAPATVQINVPGVRGMVKAEGTMALLPVWGVMLVATNEDTGAVDWCLTDTQGKFVLDTGEGASRMLVLSRGDQEVVRNMHVDMDGVTYPEPEALLAFPARACGLLSTVNTGWTGSAWLGLPNASGRIVVGDTVAYNGVSDLMGQMALGGIPELYPRTATVNYQVLYQKSGYESMVMALQSDPAVVAQHTPTLDTAEPQGCVVRGTVVGTNNLPVAGVQVDFGPAFTPLLTGSNGVFTASGIMRGQYFVQLSGDQFDPTYESVTIPPAGTNVYTLPQPLRIQGGRFSVYGEICSAENGMPIHGATVTVVEAGLRKAYPKLAGATTNETTTTRTGYFDLPVVKGSRTIMFSAPGYESTTIVVNAGTHVQQPVQLTPVPEPAIAGVMALCVLGIRRRAPGACIRCRRCWHPLALPRAKG